MKVAIDDSGTVQILDDDGRLTGLLTPTLARNRAWWMASEAVESQDGRVRGKALGLPFDTMDAADALHLAVELFAAGVQAAIVARMGDTVAATEVWRPEGSAVDVRLSATTEADSPLVRFAQ